MTSWLFAAAAVGCLALRWALAGRQLDATPLLFALVPLNAMSFSLRRALAWTRGAVMHPNEPKKDLFVHAGERAAPRLEARERELRARYGLGRLFAASTAAVYRENLYLLDLLDRHVDEDTRQRLESRTAVRAVDVGSKDFRYAFALARWLRSAGNAPPREVSLTGIELDGHHVYTDLHSRRDHAEAFVRQVDEANVTYEVADFLDYRAADVDVVFFFFPFVLEYALVRWGLPRRFFAPERIFLHAHEVLAPGGLVIVMNHTDAERERQVVLLEASGFEIVRSGSAESQLVDYAADVPQRSLTVARRRS